MVFLVLLLTSSVAFGAEELVMNGSTTVLPIAQKAAEVYMKENPGVNISLSGTGSGDGIKALIDGTTDIANSSRFIKDSEITQAIGNGVFPVPHRVALDSIVPVVHPKNPVNGLSIEQLKKIYTGEITNWKVVGGENKEIVVISRDTSSGTYEVWHEKVLNKERVTPAASLLASNGAVVTAVAQNSYAIGYIGLGYVNKEVKMLNVGGVTPNTATTRSGKYPIARELFMFTEGWPKGVVMDFINFIVSPRGQALVVEVKYVPIYDVNK
ncbi:phosphate ABC transporter substrate-binding protein [Candidatus Poribacteria bacterium]|nr:phosphate ABC transporter substrate-binding protein [Candidatus Poribacteria bacterium]